MYINVCVYIYAYMHRFVYTSIDQYTYLYMHEQGSVINLLCNMCWISQRHGKVKTWFALDAITLIPFDIIELALNAQEVAVRPGLGRVGTWHSPKIYPKETCSLGQPTFFGIFAQIVEALISFFQWYAGFGLRFQRFSASLQSWCSSSCIAHHYPLVN